MIAICELHLLRWPLCYSPWSYVIALGWLTCRLLQRNTAVLKLSACARACGAAWWARQLACLRIHISLGQFYLVYWPRKCYSWCKGEKIARGGTEKGRAPCCVSLTLTGLKWIWSCNCCLGKRRLLCLRVHLWWKAACLFQSHEERPFPSSAYRSVPDMSVLGIWVSHFPYHLIWFGFLLWHKTLAKW